MLNLGKGLVKFVLRTLSDGWFAWRERFPFQAPIKWR